MITCSFLIVTSVAAIDYNVYICYYKMMVIFDILAAHAALDSILTWGSAELEKRRK